MVTSCRKLVDADQRYNEIVHQMHAADAEFKEVLTQYDLEFEEKGQQMSEKLHKVCTHASVAGDGLQRVFSEPLPS